MEAFSLQSYEKPANEGQKLRNVIESYSDKRSRLQKSAFKLKSSVGVVFVKTRDLEPESKPTNFNVAVKSPFSTAADNMAVIPPNMKF